LSWLEPKDEAAVYTFDTRLDEVAPFTSGLKKLPESMATVTRSAPPRCTMRSPGWLSASALVKARRRAVVVFTDGRDNSSRLTPTQVSGIASSIDVPVYVLRRSVDR
jgi:hypothetical protein